MSKSCGRKSSKAGTGIDEIFNLVRQEITNAGYAKRLSMAIYGGNKAAGRNVGMIKRRQIGGAGLERVAGRFKTWFQDFF